MARTVFGVHDRGVVVAAVSGSIYRRQSLAAHRRVCSHERMMRMRGLGILTAAMLVSGCGSRGTIHYDPAAPLPADPLVTMKVGNASTDPLAFITALGSAPGQQPMVMVSGDGVDVDGVCFGPGFIILAVTGPDVRLRQPVKCGGGWSLTAGLRSPGRYTVTALPCGYVTKWAADVLGRSSVTADQTPTADPSPPSCGDY